MFFLAYGQSTVFDQLRSSPYLVTWAKFIYTDTLSLSSIFPSEILISALHCKKRRCFSNDFGEAYLFVDVLQTASRCSHSNALIDFVRKNARGRLCEQLLKYINTKIHRILINISEYVARRWRLTHVFCWLPEWTLMVETFAACMVLKKCKRRRWNKRLAISKYAGYEISVSLIAERITKKSAEKDAQYG